MPVPDRPALERLACALIRDDVREHGPVTRASARSCAQRVAPALHASCDWPLERLERLLGGALISCHDAHGPVDAHWASSAAARLVAHLRAEGLWRRPTRLTPAAPR